MEATAVVTNGSRYSCIVPLQFKAGITDPAVCAKSELRGNGPQGMIHATEIKRTEMPVPDNNPQKPYEYVSGITDQTSPAWAVLHGKEKAIYEHDGTIRIAGYTAVAMGKRYGSPGDRFDIELSSGKWIRVIIVDSKQKKDTKDRQGWTGKNGHILEMVVWSVSAKVQIHGSYNVLPVYSGKVIKIYKEANK